MKQPLSMMKNTYCQKPNCGWILALALMLIGQSSIAQEAENPKAIDHVGGAVTVTNNGVSLLPTFSLGRPAVMFDLNVGNKKLTFEPQFRFGLDGTPWSFLFWWRYKLVQKEKFKMSVGAHPSVVFRPTTIAINGVPRETFFIQQYFAAEISPNYYITKNISVGIYYLHSNSMDNNGIKNTNFITINSNFSNIKLSEQFYMKFNPQAYYLKMDEQDGYYVTATIGLAKKNFPIALQSILNQAIETNIPAKSEFVWNVSLIYSFRNEFVKK
jgi:hypothetical protein